MKLISLFLVLFIFSNSQEFRKSYYFDQLKPDQIIQFNDSLFIIPLTESLRFDNITLNRGIDYNFNYSFKQIRILRQINLSDSLIVQFEIIPLKKQYQLAIEPKLYEPNSNDSNSLKSIFFEAVKKENSSSFANINSSGSIYRGFRLTTNQDLKLESGLNLNLDGKLSENISITAAITDEATPIQPEGSTQNLSEIDKIYINITGPEFDAVVGDFDYSINQDNLLNYSRRLNGINVLYKNDRLNVGGIISTSRSQFHQNILLTKEGLQGPYKLSSPNNNLDILIIAGSEKVYLDGSLQKRGSNNDYIIEYADGTIRFTNQRVIKANQRLEVEFEYVEALQRFNRSIYQAQNEYKAKSFSSKFIFIQEKDDINNPISSETGFTDEERLILTNAGNDKLKATSSSIVSSNTGLYDKVFNQNANDTILVYKADRTGKYSATFSNVGTNKGSYSRISRFNNQYEFVGLNKGDYKPIRFIPIPQAQSIVFNISEISYGETDLLKLSTAISVNDQNVFSSIDDDLSNGLFVDLWNKNSFKNVYGFSQIDLVTKMKYRSKYFHPLNRNQIVDQFSEYGFNQDDIIANQRQFSEQITLKTKQTENELIFTGIEYGETLLALKLNTNHRIDSGNKDRSIKIESAFLDTKNESNHHFQRLKSMKSVASQRVYGITVEATYNLSQRLINTSQLNGLAGRDIGLKLSRQGDVFDDVSYQFNLSKEQLRDTTSANNFIDFSNETEHSITAKLSNASISNSTRFSIRNRNIDPFFLKLTDQKSRYFNSAFTDSNYSNNQSILIENNLRYKAYTNALNVNFNYRTGSELTAKRELIYQQVSPGFGNYRKDGDVFVPDNKGDYIRFILPGNQFEPVTKVNVLFQLKFDPALHQFNQSIYTRLLNNFSYTGNLNLLEESRLEDRNRLYLLDPAALLGDHSANASLQIYQYIYYRANDPDFNAELSFQNNQQVINTFVNDVSGENNRSRSYEWSIKFNYRFSKSFRFSNTFKNSKQHKRVSSDSTLNRLISGNQLSQSITYFPFSSVSIIDEISFSFQTNEEPLSFIRIRQISNTTSINYRISDKGSIRGKFEYSEVNDPENPNKIALPYEMANGRQIGINKEWVLNAIYRLSDNLNFDFSYSGRKNALDPDVINIMRMELRLLF